MPKKTKKEKLLARYHRKLRLLENRSTVVTYTSPPPSVSSPKIEPIKKQGVKIEPTVITSEEKQLNQYFFSDLRKSLLLIVLIIGVEVSLYGAKLIK